MFCPFCLQPLQLLSLKKDSLYCRAEPYHEFSALFGYNLAAITIDRKNYAYGIEWNYEKSLTDVWTGQPYYGIGYSRKIIDFLIKVESFRADYLINKINNILMLK